MENAPLSHAEKDPIGEALAASESSQPRRRGDVSTDAWELRSADLEWLFRLTGALRGVDGERRVLEELVAAATARLNSGLGVLYLPEKRVTVKFTLGPSSQAALLESWSQTRETLINWVQRHNRPLRINGVGRNGRHLMRSKVVCVPVATAADRVMGSLAFFNPLQAHDYEDHHEFLARHIGRQAASIVEALFDAMTGLYTRAGLDQIFDGLPDDGGVAESQVIYVDIDHTNIANELHGFELGNELIVQAAELLTAPLLPASALAARIHGDRFVVVLPNVSSLEAVRVADGLQAAATKIAIGPPNDVFDVSISCGVAALLPVPDGIARAIAAAEVACKKAKTRGRNRVEVYASDDGSMMRYQGDALVVGQLRSALKADRLVLFAQRIVPLQDMSLPGGYEILLRVQEVDGTLISPGLMIGAAQRYQLLPSVDRWVVRRALQMLAPYRSMLASRGIGMSINVSGQSIGDETFMRQFTELLKDARLPRESVSVELTEQAAITNLEGAKQMVSRLGALGCGFALDDFGTGANSLTILKALPVNRVKIDGCFVRDIRTDRNSRATVRAIVELAKGLGIQTVAEFVETAEIAHEIRLLGVDYAQGYAYSRPEALAGVLEGLVKDESQRLHRLFLNS
jgi:diguanylate cyclase (GGDEF)-like protein